MYTLFINKLKYNDLEYIAKRMRYKVITNTYIHFVFQNMRVETLFSNNEFYLCIVKGSKSKQKINDSKLFNNNIVFITDYNSFILDSKYADELMSFDKEFKKFYNKYKKEKI